MSLQGDLWTVSLVDIPDLDKVVSRCRGEDLRSRWVEDDLSDLTEWGQLGVLYLLSARELGTWTYRPPAFSLPSGLKSSACHPSSPHPSKMLSWIFQIQTTSQRHPYRSIEERMRVLTLSILTTGHHQVVVKGRPGGIEDRSGMTSS